MSFSTDHEQYRDEQEEAFNAQLLRDEQEVWFVHKYEVSLEYGGPEEGGWWYDRGTPAEDWNVEGFTSEDEAYARCRELNLSEQERAKRDEQYEYTSVLAYRSTHYAYDVSPDAAPHAYPETRPHYE